MIKYSIDVAVVVLLEALVLFIKDIDCKEGNIVELASAAKGIEAQRITTKTNDMIISFLPINW